MLSVFANVLVYAMPLQRSELQCFILSNPHALHITYGMLSMLYTKFEAFSELLATHACYVCVIQSLPGATILWCFTIYNVFSVFLKQTMSAIESPMFAIKSRMLCLCS